MAAGAWIKEDHHVIEGVLRGLGAMHRPAGASFPLGLLAAATHFFTGFVTSIPRKKRGPGPSCARSTVRRIPTLWRFVAAHATLTRHSKAARSPSATRRSCLTTARALAPHVQRPRLASGSISTMATPFSTTPTVGTWRSRACS